MMSNKGNIGDAVRIIGTGEDTFHFFNAGVIGTITRFGGSDAHIECDGAGQWVSPSDYEVIDNDRIAVLDHGYVRVADVFGSDLSVVNAARASFDKESSELSKRDERLIQFLAREGHHSPFRHALMTFEIYAPLMITRQWWKYVVGSDHTMDAHNESSRRYVTEEPTFYLVKADEWRSAPDNSKQGSGEPVSVEIGEQAAYRLQCRVMDGIDDYNWALRNGICAEQARLFLPAYGLFVRWRWTASLQSIGHMLEQRLAHDAQKEFRDYAHAVYKLAKRKFPVSIAALVDYEEEEE